METTSDGLQRAATYAAWGRTVQSRDADSRTRSVVNTSIQATLGPALRPTSVDTRLASSLVLNRVIRQLQHILPQDRELLEPDEARIDRTLHAIGEDGLFRIAELFCQHDIDKNGKLDTWEFHSLVGELTSFVPGNTVQVATLAPINGKPQTFLEFAENFAAVHGRGGSAAVGTSPLAGRAPREQRAQRTVNFQAPAPPTTDEAVTNEAIDLLAAHGRGDGTIGLLEFKKMYHEKLVFAAQSSVAKRDALGTVPSAELRIIFDQFEKHDPKLEGTLNEASFVKLWPALRTCDRTGAHSGRRYPVVCILLPSVPDLSEEELRALFRAADDDGGNIAGQGLLDVNEVVSAMVDAAELAFERRALAVVQNVKRAHEAVRGAHLRPELVDAVPVAIRLLRGMDPGGDATLEEAEFIRGFRFLIDAARRLTPPLLENSSKERRRLKTLFQAADLNHDGMLDANEWLLLLQLQQNLLPALVLCSHEPFRNQLVRNLRESMKAAAERRQRQIWRGEAGEASEGVELGDEEQDVLEEHDDGDDEPSETADATRGPASHSRQHHGSHHGSHGRRHHHQHGHRRHEETRQSLVSAADQSRIATDAQKLIATTFEGRDVGKRRRGRTNRQSEDHKEALRAARQGRRPGDR